jgi:hypothetical protein
MWRAGEHSVPRSSAFAFSGNFTHLPVLVGGVWPSQGRQAATPHCFVAHPANNQAPLAGRHWATVAGRKGLAAAQLFRPLAPTAPDKVERLRKY